MSYLIDKETGHLQWKPTYKQELFLALPWGIKEGFYAGSAGAGKSDVLLMYPIVHGWYRHPKFKGLYLRRTFPELREEIIPRSREYFLPLGATYNKTEALWTFPSGALMFFGHCENEQDVHNYDSMQPNYVAFDELTSFTEFQYLYITLERVRRDIDVIGTLPAIARSASNPGNIGHAWVKKRFIDPEPKGFKKIIGKGGNSRIFIPATLLDNPYIDPEYSRSLDGLPEAERQAKKFGSWSAYEGQVFSEFRVEKLPSEPENAIHVIEPFDIPDWWPRLVAIDWGFAAMTWVGFAAISPKRRAYVYRELVFQKEDIVSWAPKVLEYLQRENIKKITICKSAGQHRGQHTIQEQIEDAWGHKFSLNLSDNSPGSRIAGKMLLHEYFRFNQRYVPSSEIPEFDQEKANWLARNDEQRYKKYLEIFKPVEEEKNLPKVQIFNTCENLVSAIKSCVYDRTHPEDVAEFPGDDPYDGFRYLVNDVDQYFGEAESYLKKLQAQEDLYKALDESKDWTSFYRKAEKIGDIGHHLPKPVARYRGRVHVIH